MTNAQRAALLAALLCASGAAAAQSTQVVSGTLMLLNGDFDPARGGGSVSIARLRTDAGAVYHLDLTGAARPDEGLHRLAGKRVELEVIEGAMQADAAPGSLPILRPRRLSAAPGAKFTAKAVGNKPWISILCKFAGNVAEPRAPAFFSTQLSNTFPGFNHYFREASYGALTLDGSTAHTVWVSMPQPRNFYIDGTKTSAVYLKELAEHCTAAADPVVNYATFTGVNLMFNGELDNAAWGGQQAVNLDGVDRVVPMTWMPYHGENSEFGWRQHGILAHEMAHGFGAPHSASPDGNEYGSSWDVVSNPGADCLPNVTDPNYGCIGQSMNAQAKIIMEMMPPARVGNYPGTGTQEFLVERLAQPPLAGGTFQAVKVALPGTTTKFLSVESRMRVGYDVKLPGDGVIIHLVDTALDPPARLVAPVGAVGPGGLGAIWPVGGTYTHVSGVSVTVLARDAVTGTATISVTFTAPVVASKRSDFNGDGRSDVAWRNAVSGINYYWHMDGVNITAQGFLPSVPAGWNVAGLGDVNADGRADYFWRDDVNGLNYQWLMNGADITSQGYLPGVPAPWVVAGMGDLDGDNRADVLWRNPATGENYVWLMNGLAIASQGFLPPVGGTDWEVVGVADYSGDARADVLWRNKATGENYLWQMNGLVLQAQGFLPPVPVPDWEVVGSPNLDGDARADVLWRNKVTGDNYAWLMNGFTLVSQGFLPNVGDAGWKVVGFGDYNNDGRSDILWRHAVSGVDYQWSMNGLAITGQGFLPNVADADWKPVK